jgi:hypothetical protein
MIHVIHSLSISRTNLLNQGFNNKKIPLKLIHNYNVLKSIIASDYNTYYRNLELNYLFIKYD